MILIIKPMMAKLIHPIEYCPRGTIEVKNELIKLGMVNSFVSPANVEIAS